MQSQIERISPVECRVRVQVPWAEVSPRLDSKLRDLRQRSRVPGFRPGKVPPAVLDRMFGRSIRDELARDLVQETFQTAVVQHAQTPLTQPVLESSALETGCDFEYAARFEVAPILEPKLYTGVPVRRRPASVQDTAIDAALDRKRRDLTQIRPITDGRDRTRPGDVWTADIEGTFGPDRVARKDVSIEIGADAEFIPGIGAAMSEFVPADVGATRTLRFSPPQERLREEFKGREVEIKVALREVREKVVPALDDDFARDTGEAESLEELRAKVKEGLLSADRDEAEREARRRLVEELLVRNGFDPAPSMVARETAAQVEQFQRQASRQGVTLAQLGTTPTKLAQQMRPQALFNVKAFLLLDAIGKAESIDVTDAELDAEVETQAQAKGQSAARLRATMQKNNELLLLRAQMREERILDFLMAKAEVQESPDPEPAGTAGSLPEDPTEVPTSA